MDEGVVRVDTGFVASYRVSLRASPMGTAGHCARPGGVLAARRLVRAACARAAACELASAYVDAGLIVDWSARMIGLRRWGRRWSGRFVPEGGDDGPSNVREPRRPAPPTGSAGAALELPLA